MQPEKAPQAHRAGSLTTLSVRQEAPPQADCSGCQLDGHFDQEPTPASLPMSLLREAQQP